MYVIINRTAVTSWWCPSDNHIHAIFSRYRDLHLSVCVPVSRSSLSPRWFCIYVFLCYSAVSVYAVSILLSITFSFCLSLSVCRPPSLSLFPPHAVMSSLHHMDAICFCVIFWPAINRQSPPSISQRKLVSAQRTRQPSTEVVLWFDSVVTSWL